ncbi:MAG: hypothetical protein IPG53_23655 [Ignavibacteriales bacterium]|nr:hypothetical protein [Ignavibacteriales bacterium]
MIPDGQIFSHQHPSSMTERSQFLALLLFILPAKKAVEEKGTIIDAWIIRDIPQDVILLFGDGFALAEGFVKVDCQPKSAKSFDFAQGIPIIVVIFAICMIVTFLTELTSKYGNNSDFPPNLALCRRMNVDPLLLFFQPRSQHPWFMMPVRPPNAIVFWLSKAQIADAKNRLYHQHFWSDSDYAVGVFCCLEIRNFRTPEPQRFSTPEPQRFGT